MVEPVEPTKRASNRCHAAMSGFSQQRRVYDILLNAVVCIQIAFMSHARLFGHWHHVGRCRPALCVVTDAEYGRCFCSSFCRRCDFSPSISYRVVLHGSQTAGAKDAPCSLRSLIYFSSVVAISHFQYKILVETPTTTRRDQLYLRRLQEVQTRIY
jgi:hypothetical protein